MPSAGLAPYAVHNPSTWSNAALAAGLTVSCVDVNDVRRARKQAQAGIGGITLIGSHPDRHLKKRLGKARRAAPHNLAPFVMSDEEGGEVQRLRSKIYPLPSAKTMGGGTSTTCARLPRSTGRGCAPSVSRWTSLRWLT